MARPVKFRASYINDAGFMVRLSEAIEKDERLESDRKKEILGLLQALTSLLMSTGNEA